MALSKEEREKRSRALRARWEGMTSEERVVMKKKMREIATRSLRRRGSLPYSRQRAAAQIIRWDRTDPTKREEINRKRSETQKMNWLRRRGLLPPT